MKIFTRWIPRVVMILWCLTDVVMPARADETSGLNIRTDIDSALVVLDGEVRGRTPVMLEGLHSGPHEIRVLHPDLESWISPVIIDSVNLSAGEFRDLQYRFIRQYIVRSDPSGAEVFVENDSVGTTPLLMTARAQDSVLQIQLKGFETATVSLHHAERGVVRIKLVPSTNDPSEHQHVITESGGRSALPLILSAASSVVAGGVSAYFKIQADQAYNEYLLTSDPAKLTETSKLDTVAGIALGVSQVYLALFSYLLLSH